MARLPIFDDRRSEKYVPDNLLPSFYMEDFTILGLRVGNLEQAAKLLGKNGIDVIEGDGGLELSVEGPDRLPAIAYLLHSNGITCDITDIVEQVYQG